jgi:isoquinoline 1-oxidoreductase beta subunit
MEPLNCVVDLQADKCTMWAGSQFQTGDQAAIAATAGLKPEQVTLNTMMAGGGFGRRAVPTSDYVVEAVNVAKAWRAAGKRAVEADLEPRGRHQGRLLPSVARAPRELGLDAKGRSSRGTTSSSASPSSAARRSKP